MYLQLIVTLRYTHVATHLLYSAEIVGEIWHKVSPCIGSYKEPNPTEIGSGIAGHQRVADTSNHLGEANKSLSELLVGQKTVALQNGRLNIAEGELRKITFLGVALWNSRMGMGYGNVGMWYRNVVCKFAHNCMNTSPLGS